MDSTRRKEDQMSTCNICGNEHVNGNPHELVSAQILAQQITRKGRREITTTTYGGFQHHRYLVCPACEKQGKRNSTLGYVLTGIAGVVVFALALQLNWFDWGWGLALILALIAMAIAFVVARIKLPPADDILGRIAYRERQALVGGDKNIRFNTWTLKAFEEFQKSNRIG